MLKYFIKKYIRNKVNGVFEDASNKEKLDTTIKNINKYEDKVKSLLSFLDNTKIRIQDGYLDSEELDESVEEISKLVDELVK